VTYRIGDLRNLDINLYYYLASGITTHGYTVLSGYRSSLVTSGIYLVDGYPEDPMTMQLPSIAIEHDNTRDEPLELGSDGSTEIRHFGVELYHTSDAGRDDWGERIRGYFRNKEMRIYDYNPIFTGGVISTKVGTASFTNLNMFPLPKDREHDALKYRMRIQFNCEYVITSGNSLI
jgi:hypothetical protein